MEEREAFREFYLKYAKKLYRVVERLQEIQEGKVGDITEDVVQESFLLALLSGMKSGSPVNRWDGWW